MSVRARHARRLASLLQTDSKVWVTVQYDRDKRKYVVHWPQTPKAPTTAQMSALAAEHAAEVPELDVSNLLWDQQKPVGPQMRKAG